jgi:hypothetical protein
MGVSKGGNEAGSAANGVDPGTSPIFAEQDGELREHGESVQQAFPGSSLLLLLTRLVQEAFDDVLMQ